MTFLLMNDDATVTPLTRCDDCGYLFVDIQKHVRESVTVRAQEQVMSDGAHGHDVDEVEVTDTRTGALVHVEAPLAPLQARRSGAKNVSAPEYQNAFISEARASMGQPSVEECKELVGYQVTMSFNVDWKPASGVLTEVMDHPAAGSVYLILDNYRERIYPLNAIQQITKVR